MRLAVLSDIHGNMDALEEVLADIDQAGVEAVFSLGDNIGYGAEPERVVQTLIDRGIPSVLGNHEMGALDPGFLDWFNPVARTSLTRTFGMLSPESMKFTAGLPTQMSAHGCRFVHGFPPDSPTIYLFQVEIERRARVLKVLPQRICFVGHTHVLELAGFNGSDFTDLGIREGPMALDPQLKYLLNIGSVGQPRDGDLRARYAILDGDRNTLEIRFVAYDAQAAADKILTAGLPEQHARQLLG
jgi:predicted phosphodiesterase